MKLAEFIDTFYVKIGNSYFSRYDLCEIGFLVSDAGCFDRKELRQSLKLFNTDRAAWMNKYAWSEFAHHMAERIDWIRPFI